MDSSEALSEKTKKRLKKLFDALDVDNSGTLDLEELKLVLNDEESGTTFSDKQLQVLVRSISKKGRKKLNFEEFIELVTHINAVREVFQKIDKDQSGSIDHEELEEALKEMGFNFNEQHIRLFIHMADDDASGTIEFEEFFQLDFFLKRAQMLFEAADMDDSGELDIHELKEILPVLDVEYESDEQLNNFMTSLDRNSNGTLSFDEFVSLLFCLMYQEHLG